MHDPGSARGPNYTGFGAALEAPAPFGTLVAVEWGYGVRGVNSDGSRGRTSSASVDTRCFMGCRGYDMPRALFGIASQSCRSLHRRTAAQQPFRTQVDLVHFSVIVTDKQGAPITGLTADDFELIEDGQAAGDQLLPAGDPGKRRLGRLPHSGLLLDTSGSMEDDIKDVRTGGDQVPQRRRAGRRHHAGRLRHRGPPGALLQRPTTPG